MPREADDAQAGLARLRDHLGAATPDAAAPQEGSSFARRSGEAAAALAAVEPGDRLVVFVGKLIAP